MPRNLSRKWVTKKIFLKEREILQNTVKISNLRKIKTVYNYIHWDISVKQKGIYLYV